MEANNMFTEKTYRIYCHVCKDLRDYKASFLSTGTSKDIDGITYPVSTCGQPKHTPSEIRASYLASQGGN
jgi:hypothetical protein